MDGRVPSDLTGCHVVVSGMEGQAQDVISVGGVEPLLVGGASVDHTQCCNVVDYVPVFGVEEVVATIVTTVTGEKKTTKSQNLGLQIIDIITVQSRGVEPWKKYQIPRSNSYPCTNSKVRLSSGAFPFLPS